MSGAEVLLGAVAGLLGLVTASGYYLLRRLQKLEKESEARHTQELERMRTENANLLRRVADLEVKAERVPALEQQLRVLTRQLEDLQAWKAQAQAAIDEKDQTIETQAREIRQLESDKRALLDENARLKTANATFERALTLLGLKLKDDEQADANAGEDGAGEHISDNDVKKEMQSEH